MKSLLFKLAIAVIVLACGTYLYFQSTQAPAKDISDDGKYLYADYNFDGFLDRARQIDCGATGNCSYLIEPYDPIRRMYSEPPDGIDVLRADNDYFVVTNPAVNEAEKIVCSYSNFSVAEWDYLIYKYSNHFYPIKRIQVRVDKTEGELTLTRRVYSITDGIEQLTTTSPEDRFTGALPKCTITNL